MIQLDDEVSEQRVHAAFISFNRYDHRRGQLHKIADEWAGARQRQRAAVHDRLHDERPRACRFNQQVERAALIEELFFVTVPVENIVIGPACEFRRAAAFAGELHPRGRKGKVTVKISGIAASAASVIAMAGDEVLMSPVAYMMIHDPWTYAMGNAREMEHQAQVLREIGEGLIAAYTTKTGKSRDEIADMLAAETYMNAEQAVREGFADGILYEEAQEPAQQPQQAMMMQARRYGPAAICAMVRAADAAHAKPAAQNPDAKRRAEIAQRAQIIADYYIDIKEREEQNHA